MILGKDKSCFIWFRFVGGIRRKNKRENDQNARNNGSGRPTKAEKLNGKWIKIPFWNIRSTLLCACRKFRVTCTSKSIVNVVDALEL